MTNSTENPLCTCPSGDGSLSHPCPMHPSSNEELNVGEVVSFNNRSDCWIAEPVVKITDDEVFTHFYRFPKSKENISWQRGIHPSLIPKGFELVESAEFEACKECIGLSKQQNDLLKEQIGLLKQTHRLELEAAQKEIDRLKGNDKPENPTLNDLWGNFDKAYFKFQSELHAFWGAIDVGRSRSFFADLHTNMHRLRRDMVSMLPDEVRNHKPEDKQS